MRRNTLITGVVTAALASLAIAPVAGAKPRHPVTRAEVFSAALRQAESSAARLETDTKGIVSMDRSRTGVGNYFRYGAFRQSASFAIFGTKTVNGEAGMLWCLGSVEVRRTKNDRTRVLRYLTCAGA
jgi:hypothetical protein